METIKTSYEELISMNRSDLDQLKEILGEDRSFCHYTSIKNCNSILENRTIWASPLGKTNDLIESGRFETNKRVFVLCFCDSKTEKIPLWYMYSGGHSGARIRLTTTKMERFIKSIQKVTGKIKGHDGQEEETVEYQRGIDFDVEFGRIYYAKSKEKIKYRNNIYALSSDAEFEQLTTSYWLKNYEWEYEKEFRIVLIFRHDVACEHIEIPIVFNYIKEIMLSPECELDFDELGTGFKDYLKSKLPHSTLQCRFDISRKYFEMVPTYIESLCQNQNESFEDDARTILLRIDAALNKIRPMLSNIKSS